MTIESKRSLEHLCRQHHPQPESGLAVEGWSHHLRPLQRMACGPYALDEPVAVRQAAAWPNSRSTSI